MTYSAAFDSLTLTLVPLTVSQLWISFPFSVSALSPNLDVIYAPTYLFMVSQAVLSASSSEVTEGAR